MTPLAQLPEVVGFFSYSREDDEAFRGSLSALRDAIQRELGAQLGRTRRNFRLWQDQQAIAPGKDWKAEITKAVEQSVFFIPIVTPRAVGSEYCQFEFSSFVARESALGRGDLVFPILWISVPALMDEAEWRDDPVLSIVAKRQYVDWRPFRHAAVGSPDFAQAVERFCGKLVETLREPWVSPGERRQLEAEAKRRAEDEELARREAEAKRQADEREAKRHAEREAGKREEAERQRQESEAKKRAEEEGANRRREEVETQRLLARRLAEERVAASAGAMPRGAVAPDQAAQNIARASSAKTWGIVGAVAGLALAGAAIALLAERGARPLNPQTVESSPPAPAPSNAAAPVPAVPSATSESPLSKAQESALKAGDSFKECGDCPDMVIVPAGTFTMGSPAGQGDDSERPQHPVTIARPFASAKFALTFDEWDACAARGDCAPHVSDSGWGRGRRPAIKVSWNDAQTYVKWLSRITGKEYQLLSEAEYEYATRAGSQTKYPWGDNIKLNGTAMANCDGCGSQWGNKQTAPVGSFAANRFGLYDMVGNVWEWTEDCWNANYQGAPADGSPWVSGDCSRRVVRGGSWYSSPDYLRSANRIGVITDSRDSSLGFRVARTLSP